MVGLPKGIKHFYKADEDVITWSSWKVKQRLMNFIFILSGLFLTITVLGIFIYNFFFTPVLSQLLHDSRAHLLLVAWFFIGTGLMFGICVYLLLTFTWMNSIHVSNDCLSFCQKGFIAPGAKQFSQKDVDRLKIQYGSRGDDNTVNKYYLYVLLYKDEKKTELRQREIVGEWLADDDLLRLFQLLKQICQQRGWLIHFEFAPNDYLDKYD